MYATQETGYSYRAQVARVLEVTRRYLGLAEGAASVPPPQPPRPADAARPGGRKRNEKGERA